MDESLPNTIIPPHKRSDTQREHEHLYHVVIGGDTVVRWCRMCGVTDLLERVGSSYGARGSFQSKWRRIKEENETTSA